MTTFVKYVGRKARKEDNVAQTGAVWSPGSIVPVNDQAAAKLLQFPDVWIAVTVEEAGDATKADEAAPPTPAVVLLTEEESDRVIHQINLQSMTKVDLRQYAARAFGKDLAEDMRIQDMRREVRNFRIGAGIRNG